MTRAVLLFGAAAIVMAIAGGVHAAGSPITAHKGVSVIFSGDTGKCSIRSKDEFAKQLDDSLGRIGLRVDPNEPVLARLTVSAKPVESLEGKCVVFVGLAFTIPMEIDFIEINEKVTNRKAMVEILEKARRFPIVLYEDNVFTASWPTNSHSDALYLVDQLAQRFAGQR